MATVKHDIRRHTSLTRAVLLAAGLGHLAACAAVTQQVPVPDFLVPPPAPAERSQAMPVAVAEIAPTPTPAPKGPERTFVDTFQSLDSTRWYTHDRPPNGTWIINGFRPSQVSLIPEGVRLTLQKGLPGVSEPYSSGEISAMQTRASGYVEAKVKAAKGSGLNTSIFTYSRTGGNETWNEIDFEILGRNTNQVELTLHAEGKSSNRVHRLGFDASQGFHTYGIEWAPGRVRWYVDNKLVHEVKGGLADRMTRDQGFHLALWGSNTLSGWMGRLDPKLTSWAAEIACAAVADAYEGTSLCAEAAISPRPAATPASAPAPAPVPAPLPAAKPAPAAPSAPSLAPVEMRRVPVPEARPSTVEVRRGETPSSELRAAVPAKAAPAPAPAPALAPIAAPATTPVPAPTPIAKPNVTAPPVPAAGVPAPTVAPSPGPLSLRPGQVQAATPPPAPETAADDDEELAGAPGRR